MTSVGYDPVALEAFFGYDNVSLSDAVAMDGVGSLRSDVVMEMSGGGADEFGGLRADRCKIRRSWTLSGTGYGER